MMVKADLKQVYTYSAALRDLPATMAPHVNRGLWGFGEKVHGQVRNVKLAGPMVGKLGRTKSGRRRKGAGGVSGWVLQQITGTLRRSVRFRRFPGLALIWTPIDYGYWQDTGFRHYRSGKRIHNPFMVPAFEAVGGLAGLHRALDEAVTEGLREFERAAQAKKQGTSDE